MSARGATDSDSFVLPEPGPCWDADATAVGGREGGVRTRCALDTEQARKPVGIVVVDDEMVKARRYNKRVRLDFPHISVIAAAATSVCELECVCG